MPPNLMSAPDPAAMLPAFGPLYYLAGMPLFLGRLRMEDHSAERVRRAAEKGPVVYALHTWSWVDWLALNKVLVQRGLPLPGCTPGVDATRWMPPGAMWEALRARLGGDRRPDVLANGELAKRVAGGEPACVFLTNQKDLRDLVVRREAPDAIPALLQAQALTDKPVQVLPVVVIWDRAPEAARTEVGRFLLGTADNPGWLGKLFTLARANDAVVQVGEPIALAEHYERYHDEPEARRQRAIRLALRRYLYREARVVRGPRARPYGQVRRAVLESREVTELIRLEASATRQPAERLRARVERIYGRMAASFSYPVVRLAAMACRFIWNRIYSGVDVRDEDVDRIREALRRGTAVLVPVHRSHLDYLLISSLLHDHDVVIPHIVAGENLSFWPLGAFFRRVGAFFVKRSFAGDRLFPVVFERYVTELVHMGVPVEFFIEGGRSRTGKSLPPKVGVLGMIFNAGVGVRPDQEVTFLPVHIGYEQIAEERAYARELQGAKKEKENVGQVVKAAKVLFQRYGKVYLRVGAPLTLREALRGADWTAMSRPHRQEVLLSTAEQLLFRVNREALALPTALVALAILAHDRRGLRHGELRARVERMRNFLAAAGVREGGGVAHVDGILAEALDRFVVGRHLNVVDEAGEKVYAIVPEGRTTIEYYKNSVLHAFAPAAYYAAAVRALRSTTVDSAAVTRLFTLQQFLLRFEFVLDPDVDVIELEARAVQALSAYGAVEVQGEQVRVTEPVRINEIANLTANFLESYLLVLRTLQSKAPVPQKEIARTALAFGKALLAVGEVVRSEALNLQNLDNAVRAFKEDGVVLVDGEGMARLADSAASYRADLERLLLLDAGSA